MDTTRLGRGEMIAAVSAVLLFLIMFIFSWFSYGAEGGLVEVDVGLNAWESFGFIDIVLLLTIIVAIGVAVMSANAQTVDLPVAGSAIVCALGILSVLLILFRIISPPDFGADDFGVGDAIDISRGIGVFLGLVAAGGIAYGGYEAMREEGTSFSAQGDRLQNRGDAPPPNQRPPAA